MSISIDLLLPVIIKGLLAVAETAEEALQLLDITGNHLHKNGEELILLLFLNKRIRR